MSKSNQILRELQLRAEHKQAVAYFAAQSLGRSDDDPRVQGRNQPQNDRTGNAQSRQQTPAPKSSSRTVYQQFKAGRRKQVQVVTRRGSLAPTVYSCKFVPSRNGGVMAAIQDPQGRVIFPDNSGPQPKNDGKNYSFHLVGPNAKGNVNFGYVLVGAPQIKILPSGKIICTNRRAPKLVATGKAVKPLPENRQGRVGDVFVRDEDDFDRYVNDTLAFEHEPGCDGIECDCDFGTDDNDAESAFWQTVEAIEQSVVPYSPDRASVHSMDTTYHGDNDHGMPRHTKTWA